MLAWKSFISWFLLIPTALWTIGWVSPAKSTDWRSMAPKKKENTGGGRDWNEARMHLLLSEFNEKASVWLWLCNQGEKFAWSLFFSSHPSAPKKQWPASLSMLLVFYTMSTTASKPQGAWQGNQKGIPRMKLDALKDDFRTPSQEKRCNRFIANCFQKVELEDFFMDSTNSESFCSFRGVVFSKNPTFLHL